MCMMLNIPPAIEAGVVDYERSSGRSVESLLIDCLQKGQQEGQALLIE